VSGPRLGLAYAYRYSLSSLQAVRVADGADALSLNAKIKELEASRLNLQEQLDNTADPEPLIHPNLAEVYRDKVENLSALLNDQDYKAEAFENIRSLIDEVRLVPRGGRLDVELKGELAGILGLCDANKKPASSYEVRAEQIKVVAGVGFEPTTFRL